MPPISCQTGSSSCSFQGNRELHSWDSCPMNQVPLGIFTLTEHPFSVVFWHLLGCSSLRMMFVCIVDMAKGKCLHGKFFRIACSPSFSSSIGKEDTARRTCFLLPTVLLEIAIRESRIGKDYVHYVLKRNWWSGKALSGSSVCHTVMRSRAEILQTQIKPGVPARICNPNPPMARFGSS